MHHPLRVAAFLLWLLAAPVFLDPDTRPRHYATPSLGAALPDLAPGDELVIVQRAALGRPLAVETDEGPVENEEVILPDLPIGRRDGAEPMPETYGGWTAGVVGRFTGPWGPPRASLAVLGTSNGAASPAWRGIGGGGSG